SVSNELGGKVVEVLVAEGDSVRAGDVLFRLDDAIYRAQYLQAQAAIGVAEAAVATAEAQLAAARIQVELVEQNVAFRQQPQRTVGWQVQLPEVFDLPAWYYGTEENLSAAQEELAAANEALDLAQADLAGELSAASNADLVALEAELALARTTYQVAQQTLAQAQASGDERLVDIAQSDLDATEAALESLQLEYDRLLTTGAAEDLLDARAEVALAQARADNATDLANQLQQGDQSLEIKAAQAGVAQAEAGLAQAQAAHAQAVAAAGVLQVQLEKTIVYAPVAGVVLARNLEVGEAVAAGSQNIVIGRLETVEMTVYIPEDRYGQVQLGQTIEVTVDSFPNQVFEGSVVRISDQAEFTPRNVQTVDGRQSTVYAVYLQVPNPDYQLKPGMPADARIEVNR
ncbi:MAG: efflux RND transporter periplasmic adaptor subunit, partial [Anaerolineales bacterium]|nr:efflux RND transporter periplasmic adaptor subunit [Anaerolineales bacterium]